MRAKLILLVCVCAAHRKCLHHYVASVESSIICRTFSRKYSEMGKNKKTPSPLKEAVVVNSTAVGGVVGAKTGAEIGAAAGTMCCPGAGTIIGGTIGGVVGAAAGYTTGRYVADQIEDNDSKKGRY